MSWLRRLFAPFRRRRDPQADAALSQLEARERRILARLEALGIDVELLRRGAREWPPQ